VNRKKNLEGTNKQKREREGREGTQRKTQIKRSNY
jgi:hypothetical protein